MSTNSSLDVSNEGTSYAQTVGDLMRKYRPNNPIIDQTKIETYFNARNITVGERLINGPNSIVYIGRKANSDKQFLLKIILSKELEQMGGHILKRTVDYSRLGSQRSLIHVYEFNDINDDYCSLVVDYYPNGSLAKMLDANGGPLPEAIASKLFPVILQALGYLHLNKMAHRKLKLENILIDQQMQPVLCDFIDGIVLDDGRKNFETVHVNLIPYLAPEVLSEIPYDPVPADIWSLGVCLFIVLNDRLPFGVGDKPSSTYKYRSTVEGELSATVKKCLKEMLQYNVNKRATASSLQNELWFRN